MEWKDNELNNLLLNLSCNLLPENLQGSEIELLKREYGEDWFNILGYNEKEYVHPEKKKHEKPPLGVMPKYLAKEHNISDVQRAKDLAAAICRFMDAEVYTTSVEDWCEELTWIIYGLRSEQNKENKNEH